MGRQLPAGNAGGGELRRRLIRAVVTTALGAGSGALSFVIWAECTDRHWLWLAHVAPAVPFWLTLLVAERWRRGPLGGSVVSMGIASLAGWIAALETAMALPVGWSLPAMGATAGLIGAVLSGLGLARARRRAWPLAALGALGAGTGALLDQDFYLTFAAWQAAFVAFLELIA